MEKLDHEIMESAIQVSGVKAKAGMLKSMHENEVESTRAAEAFGWHNSDDIETLVGLEGNFFWSEDPFRPNSIQFQFNPGQVHPGQTAFQGTYNIFGREEGAFDCVPNNPAIGWAFITLRPEGGRIIRNFIISGMMTDADWKISIMLLNKAGNQGLIQPPFTAIRMV